MAKAKDYPGFEKLGTDQLSARCYSKTSAEHKRRRKKRKKKKKKKERKERKEIKKKENDIKK